MKTYAALFAYGDRLPLWKISSGRVGTTDSRSLASAVPAGQRCGQHRRFAVCRASLLLSSLTSRPSDPAP